MNKLLHRNNKGFTLMEMLIVVAIIAILVAIAIPVFSSQLSNARLATDAANLRTAETLAVADMMTEYRDFSDVESINLRVTPDEDEEEFSLSEDCAVYYFDTSSSGMEIALTDTGALDEAGDFRSSYTKNGALTIVVCVNASGEILAAGWKAASTTSNNG